MEAVFAIVGIIVGLIIYHFLNKGRLEQARKEGRLELETELVQVKERLANRESEISDFAARSEKYDQRLEELINEKGKLREQLVEYETRLEEEQKAAREKLKTLDEAKEKMKLEFEKLAEQILEKKTDKFGKQNKERLEAILNPLKQQLGDFKKKVEETYEKETRERHSLKTEITNLQKLNVKMSEEALNLTRALKGNTKSQGAWGEIVLERILEASGLRKGSEYLTQETFRSEDRKLYRPDVIVKLPDDKDVIIDSKVSLTAYERYTSEDDPDERAKFAQEHLASVKSHVNSLSAKSYEDLKEVRSLDYVLLFMPVEGSFRLALELDENIFLWAMEKNIMIVGPSSLLVTLRTVSKIWQYEHQNRNAQLIAGRAEKLYNKFVLFVEEMEKIGKALDSASKHYETAFGRLSKGSGNLISMSQQLEKLGVKAKKQIARELVDEALVENKNDSKTEKKKEPEKIEESQGSLGI